MSSQLYKNKITLYAWWLHGFTGLPLAYSYCCIASICMSLKMHIVVIRIMVTMGFNATVETWLWKHGYIATTILHTSCSIPACNYLLQAFAACHAVCSVLQLHHFCLYSEHFKNVAIVLVCLGLCLGNLWAFSDPKNGSKMLAFCQYCFLLR